MHGPVATLLPGGRRLHLQHGPIDLVIEAAGTPREVRRAYAQAAASFQSVLPTLVAELSVLRQPLGTRRPRLTGPVARRMLAACWPHRARFVTPMAAVAGTVADHVLEALVAGRDLTRATVNNGGDIALYLAPGQTLDAGIVADIEVPSLDAVTRIAHAMPIRGIATSGRGGRSLSLGIADSVTVLAADAAAADVAATLIANAVDADDPAIQRAPARTIDPDSDLGARLVTTGVGRLDTATIAAALDAGTDSAGRMSAAGLLAGALLTLRGQHRLVGWPTGRPVVAPAAPPMIGARRQPPLARAFPTCVESAPARSPTRPPTGSYAMGGRVGERAGAD